MRALLLVNRADHAEATLLRERLSGALDRARIQPLSVSIGSAPADVSLPGRRFDPLLARRIAQTAREAESELIHALEPDLATLAALAGRLAALPVVLSVYRFELMRLRSWLRGLLQRDRWRLSLTGIRRVHVPFEIVRRDLLLAANYPAASVAVVNPGFPPPDENLTPDREALGLPDAPLIVMMPGSEPDPGFDSTLEVFKRVHRRHPGAYLVVHGSGPVVAALQRQASGLRPALPIRWLGAEADPWPVLAASTVYLHPALRDHQPFTLMMAALTGTPIVGSRLDSVAEIVEANVTGLIVTPGDVSDMAVQVGRLIQYEGLSHRLGRMARRRGMERFTIRAQADAMTTFYESTVYSTR
ncbi:MAG: glycosyltransferase family 4 protein [Anaerolineae bacterium]|nr:glycosyltransferase family 4 protein [Anaerolineae bacterium]